MAVFFMDFQKLKENYRENQDYRIVTYYRKSHILIFTPHGGGIERGTSEFVKAIAGDDLPYYLFEGLMPTARESKKMHITSTRFDESRCLEMIPKYNTTLAIHGCKGKEPIIYAGGGDRELCNKFIKILKMKDYPIVSGTGRYPGTHPSNICNRTVNGMGVQLEFSNGMRRRLFDHWENRKGRKSTTELFMRLVSDIREIIT